MAYTLWSCDALVLKCQFREDGRMYGSKQKKCHVMLRKGVTLADKRTSWSNQLVE